MVTVLVSSVSAMLQWCSVLLLVHSGLVVGAPFTGTGMVLPKISFHESEGKNRPSIIVSLSDPSKIQSEFHVAHYYQGQQKQSPEVSQLIKLHTYRWYPKLLKRSFFWADEPRPKLKKSLVAGLEAELEGPGRRGTFWSKRAAESPGPQPQLSPGTGARRMPRIPFSSIIRWSHTVQCQGAGITERHLGLATTRDPDPQPQASPSPLLSGGIDNIHNTRNISY